MELPRIAKSTSYLILIPKQVETIEDILLADYQVTRGQLDGLWAYVGNKGEKKTIPRPPKPASSGVQP